MKPKFSILLKFPYSLFTEWSHCLSPQVCRIFAFPVCLWERDPAGECGWCLALAWTTRDQVQHFYEQDCQKLSKSSVSRWCVEYKGDPLRAGSKDRKQGQETGNGSKLSEEERGDKKRKRNWDYTRGSAVKQFIHVHYQLALKKNLNPQPEMVGVLQRGSSTDVQQRQQWVSPHRLPC